jgi:hypothetical protein
MQGDTPRCEQAPPQSNEGSRPFGAAQITINNFHQLQEEAPSCRRDGSQEGNHIHTLLSGAAKQTRRKNAWTRSDSKAVRRHEEERMRPEHTLTKCMATSVIWMQEVSPVVQQDVQEERIKRYLRHDIAIEMGIDAADAMYYQGLEEGIRELTMWPGRGQ